MSRPLLIDLYCGSFGWSQGWLELGGRTVGFDLEHYPHHGPVPRGADLVLQDVRSIDGAQFRDASLILASSPCQEFSYRAMPWKRAKALGPPLLGMELFAQAERIQREAIAAAGHFIPMVQENVRGAQKYVGRARWHYGSYYLWGDVPALMPITLRGERKTPLGSWNPTRANFMGTNKGGWDLGDGIKVGDRNKGRGEDKHLWTTGWNVQAVRDMKADDATKNDGGSWFNVTHNTESGKGRNPVHTAIANAAEGRKSYASGTGNLGKSVVSRTTSSKSSARKAASARIAKIPLALSRHIARVYFPQGAEE